MPLVQTTPHTLPYVVYDAPVNEKTQKIRDMFKIGENGYAEHYQWRGLARLGPKYNYEDPFLKFDPIAPEENYSQQATIVVGSIALSAAIQWTACYMQGRVWWSKLHYFGMMSVVGSAVGLWLQEKTFERQSKKFGVVIDYAKQHPERCGETKRVKLREVLFPYSPVR